MRGAGVGCGNINSSISGFFFCLFVCCICLFIYVCIECVVKKKGARGNKRMINVEGDACFGR